jgi:dTMP kinase
MGAAFHQRLRDGFLDIARREPDRCRVIDATAPVEAVHAEILRGLSERWPDLGKAAPK